jgi:hypothetical protein
MKKLLLFITAFIALTAVAQEKPVQWTFNTVTQAGKTYLQCKANINKNVLLLSTHDIIGMEGIKTSFTFDSNIIKNFRVHLSVKIHPNEYCQLFSIMPN